MENTNKILQTLKDTIPFIRERYHVETLEVFGSYIRGDQQEKSDLDLLVTFSKNPGLIKFIELENYLTDKLNVKVDLVMKDSLKPRIGKQILKEARLI